MSEILQPTYALIRLNMFLRPKNKTAPENQHFSDTDLQNVGCRPKKRYLLLEATNFYGIASFGVNPQISASSNSHSILLFSANFHLCRWQQNKKKKQVT